MTVAAVAVLQTIARNEFERDCHDSEDFDWIQGRDWDDPPVPAVKEIIVELEGKNYVFPAAAVVEEIKGWEEYFRWELESENEEEEEEEEPTSWHIGPGYRSEEQIEEEIWERVHKHFFAQIDTEEEALAAFQARLDYFLKHFEELVAFFNMIVERQPDLRPHMLETLEMAQKAVQDTLQRWIDENCPEGAEGK